MESTIDHPAGKPASFREDPCQGALHPQAILGLVLFNKGQFFEAHEALEAAWRDEKGPIRDMYRAILQVGVGYYHAIRGNYVGAIKMFRRSKPWLAPFPDTCRGVDLAAFRRDFSAAESKIKELGPDRIRYFDPSILKPVIFQLDPGNQP